jgi:hypothetical protein
MYGFTLLNLTAELTLIMIFVLPIRRTTTPPDNDACSGAITLNTGSSMRLLSQAQEVLYGRRSHVSSPFSIEQLCWTHRVQMLVNAFTATFTF